AGAERLFGYSADEMIGEPITRLLPPDRLAEEVGILAHIRRGERIEHLETVRLRKDGSLVEVSETISPIKARGRIVGASKIARDITERRREEQRGRLMAEAGRLLGATLDAEATLADFTRLTVPLLCDWCTLDVLGEQGLPRRLA